MPQMKSDSAATRNSLVLPVGENGKICRLKTDDTGQDKQKRASIEELRNHYYIFAVPGRRHDIQMDLVLLVVDAMDLMHMHCGRAQHQPEREEI